MTVRPLYETQADRDVEWAVGERVAAHFGCFVNKNPALYPIDLTFWREQDGLIAMAEVKHRNMVWGQYPDIMISLAKAYTLAEWSRETVRSSFFFVHDNNDNVYGYDFMLGLIGDGLHMTWGGRTANTRSPGDIEPVLHIDCKLFKPLDKISWPPRKLL